MADQSCYGLRGVTESGDSVESGMSGKSIFSWNLDSGNRIRELPLAELRKSVLRIRNVVSLRFHNFRYKPGLFRVLICFLSSKIH